MRCFLLAAGVLGGLLIAGAASATVYVADFTGPELDANLTATEPSGYTHTVGLGTAVLTSPAQPGSPTGTHRHSTYETGILANDDFDAKLTVDISQLGSSSFYFIALTSYQARILLNTEGIFGDINYQPDNGAAYGSIPTVGNLITLEIKHELFLTSVFGNDVLLASYYRPEGPTQFSFGLDDFSGTAKGYTAAFVQNFSVTTPTVCTPAAAPGSCASGTPEPASWALLIAGFGLSGAMLRGRRSRDSVAI